MKIVNLINPPSLELFDPSAYPHLGLLYLGSALKNEGFKCNYVDLSDKKNLIIPDADFNLITVLYSTYISALKVRNVIKQGKVIIGGVHATLFPEQTFKDFKPDLLITGEAENDIGNILRKNITSGIIHCGVSENLDKIAFPDRELIPREKLRNLSGIHVGRYSGDGASTSIISSRGCPFQCSFCCKIPQNSYFRMRSPKNVLDEMVEVRDKYNINHFRFWDECFTLNKKRVYNLCSLLKKGDFYWLSISRVDTIDQQLLTIMHEAGCREIEFGIESGSQKILDDMSKGTTIKQNIEAIEMAKKVGIKVRALIIEGYPTETETDIRLTEQFLIDSQPDIVSVCSFVAHPGSRDYNFYPPDPNGRRYLYSNVESEFKQWIIREEWKKE